MYITSEAYKIQSKKPLRNETKVKISFGIVDPQASMLSSLSDNGHLPYSAVERVDLGLAVPRTYQTFEHNRFFLDGKNSLSVNEDFLFQGYVGSEISGADGRWVNNPMVVVDFSDYTQFSALSFNFDPSTGDYPSEFQIIGYNNSTEVYNVNCTPNKAESYVLMEQTPILNKLVFIWKKSHYPYRRARLAGLIWGFTQELTEDDIMSCNMSHSVDLLSTSLPTFTFNFTMLDTTKSYDPENPSTLWDYLESMQPVNVQLGYVLDDGDVEWVTMCNNYTTGDVSVGSQGVVTEVTFNTTSLLSLLDTQYTNGLYRDTEISLYDLANDVLSFIQYNYTADLDNVLKTIYTKNPLPTLSVKECLQLIANAGMCVLDVSRTGVIQIKRYSKSLTDMYLDFDEMIDTPTTSKIPMLKNVNTQYTKFDKQVEEKEITKIDVYNASNTTLTINHSAIYDGVVSVGTGLTLISANYYTYNTIVTVTGQGVLTLNGKNIDEANIQVVKNYSTLGADCDISNVLVDSYEKAKIYADWIAVNLQRRNQYVFTDRGYMELDTQDDISIETNFGSKISGTVVDNTIEYNGAIRGSNKVIAW